MYLPVNVNFSHKSFNLPLLWGPCMHACVDRSSYLMARQSPVPARCRLRFLESTHCCAGSCVLAQGTSCTWSPSTPMAPSTRASIQRPVGLWTSGAPVGELLGCSHPLQTQATCHDVPINHKQRLCTHCCGSATPHSHAVAEAGAATALGSAIAMSPVSTRGAPNDITPTDLSARPQKQVV